MSPTFTQLLRQHPLFKCTVQHPFVNQLHQGTLSMPCFVHYLQQDQLYLRTYRKTLSSAAQISPPEYQNFFTDSALSCIHFENMMQGELFRKFRIKPTESTSKACENYCSFLLRLSKSNNISQHSAALYACYAVYAEIGKERDIRKSHYRKWIETYQNPDFQKSAQQMDEIVNDLFYKNPSQHMKMTNLFLEACFHEHAFWSEALSISDLEKSPG